MGGIGAAEGRRRGISWRGVGNGGSVGAGGENGPQAEPSGRTVPAGGARSGGGTLPGLRWVGTGGGGGPQGRPAKPGAGGLRPPAPSEDGVPCGPYFAVGRGWKRSGMRAGETSLLAVGQGVWYH